MVQRLICLAIGYLFGLFHTSYFYGKAHGIDIREYGSGNAGTTNALRVLGKKAGAIVLIGDLFKCIIAVILTKLVFGPVYPEIKYLLCLYTGAGAVLGHNFPFYMGFKGGKGVAATGGLILSFHPYFIPTVFWKFLYYPSGIAGISSGVCGLYDTDRHLRAVGSVCGCNPGDAE